MSNTDVNLVNARDLFARRLPDHIAATIAPALHAFRERLGVRYANHGLAEMLPLFAERNPAAYSAARKAAIPSLAAILSNAAREHSAFPADDYARPTTINAIRFVADEAAAVI